MESEQSFGFVVMTVGFEYNDETYDIGNGGGHIEPAIFATEEDAKFAMREMAREEIGSYSVGSFGYGGYAEPAYAKGQEWGLEIGEYGDGDSYSRFFEEAQNRGVDWVEFLPNNLYEIIRVELKGLALRIVLPDEQIEKAKTGLIGIHKEFGDG